MIFEYRHSPRDETHLVIQGDPGSRPRTLCGKSCVGLLVGDETLSGVNADCVLCREAAQDLALAEATRGRPLPALGKAHRVSATTRTQYSFDAGPVYVPRPMGDDQDDKRIRLKYADVEEWTDEDGIEHSRVYLRGILIQDNVEVPGTQGFFSGEIYDAVLAAHKTGELS